MCLFSQAVIISSDQLQESNHIEGLLQGNVYTKLFDIVFMLNTYCVTEMEKSLKDLSELKLDTLVVFCRTGRHTSTIKNLNKTK